MCWVYPEAFFSRIGLRFLPAAVSFLLAVLLYPPNAFNVHYFPLFASYHPMVSAIWNAASEGDLEQVKQLLSAEKEQQQTSGIDVEIKGMLSAHSDAC